MLDHANACCIPRPSPAQTSPKARSKLATSHSFLVHESEFKDNYMLRVIKAVRQVHTSVDGRKFDADVNFSSIPFFSSLVDRIVDPDVNFSYMYVVIYRRVDRQLDADKNILFTSVGIFTFNRP